MIQLFKMAYRDLGRNRRRSFFSSLALAMGLGLLLLMAAMVNGEMSDSMDTSIKLQSGHLQVRSANYNPDKASLAWNELLENPADLSAQVSALPQVKVATPRLFASGIVAKGDQSRGVSILGVDPASEANEPYRSGLVSGQIPAADDRDGVLIGQTLAEKMGYTVGDSIYLMVNTSSGDVAEQPFTVRGIYTTGTASYDEATVLMPLDKAQAITQAGNHASAIFVLLKDRSQVDSAAASIPAGYQVKNYIQMNDLLSQANQLSSGYMYVLYLIVLAITATVIVNTLVMAVFERTREIGILAAIGMKGRRIMAMFFAESSLLAVGGIAMGLVLGGLMVAYATKVGFYIGNIGLTGMLLGDRIYALLNIRDAVVLTILAFIVTLLAALYPAMLAARMEPVDALRGGK